MGEIKSNCEERVNNAEEEKKVLQDKIKLIEDERDEWERLYKFATQRSSKWRTFFHYLTLGIIRK